MIISVPLFLAVVLTIYAARQVILSKKRANESLAKTTSTELLDKIDRNFYERYGDVQAFAYNRLAVEALTYNVKTPELQDFMNTMTQYYVLYDLMLLCDTNGNILASNTKDKFGKVINTSILSNINVAKEPWFSQIVTKNIDGAWYSDFMFSEYVKICQSNKKPSWGMGFAAPVKDINQKTIGIWYNFANWDEVTRGIRKSAENSLKTDGAFIIITNNKNEIIDTPDSSLIYSKTIFNLQTESIPLFSKNLKADNFSIGTNKATGAYTYKGKNWNAYTLIPKQNIELTILFSKEIIGLVIFDVICLAIAIFLSIQFSNKLSKRIITLKTAIDDLSKGETKQIALEGNDELTEISSSINHLSKALTQKSKFAENIGNRTFDTTFNISSDKDTLGIALLNMRDSLASFAEAEKKENWAIEGLALFADILQKEQNSNSIFDTILAQLVKYTNSNQAALYMAEENVENNTVLVLKACYAYNRKKFINDTIEIGDGLVGQCFLEKEEIYLTDVPKDYMNISSGLGEAKPRCVCIIPIKTNDKVLGVLEIASFQIFEDYQTKFLLKLSENLATTFSVLKANANTQKLLSESQSYLEMVQAQEEELRQYMEELHSTQEEINRKQQLSEKKSDFLNTLLEKLPFAVFVKDEQSRYSHANKAQSELIGLPINDFLNKKDDDFILDREELHQIQESDNEILKNQKSVILDAQKITLKNKETKILQTHKIPFLNPITNEYNILGVSVELDKSNKSI
ncbi:MAG: GAF domain-containing protein [Cytophagales bacterium]